MEAHRALPLGKRHAVMTMISAIAKAWQASKFLSGGRNSCVRQYCDVWSSPATPEFSSDTPFTIDTSNNRGGKHSSMLQPCQRAL